MINKKFNRITITEIKGSRCNYICECGTVRNNFSSKTKDITSGRVKSCSCYQKDRLITHGQTGTRELYSFLAARRRCKKRDSYKNIKFNLKDIDEVLNAIGKCPDKFELDRIDPDGNYEIGNIRWADDSTQAANKNKSKNNTSGAKGVSLKGGRWQSQISKDKQKIHLGYFDSFEEAHQEYLMYHFILHNEYPPEFRI